MSGQNTADSGLQLQHRQRGQEVEDWFSTSVGHFPTPGWKTMKDQSALSSINRTKEAADDEPADVRICFKARGPSSKVLSISRTSQQLTQVYPVSWKQWRKTSANIETTKSYLANPPALVLDE